MESEYENNILSHVWCLCSPAAVMMEVPPSMLQFSLAIPGSWVHCWMLVGTCVYMTIGARLRRTGPRQVLRRTAQRSVLLWFYIDKMQHQCSHEFCLCHDKVRHDMIYYFRYLYLQFHIFNIFTCFYLFIFKTSHFFNCNFYIHAFISGLCNAPYCGIFAALDAASAV